MNRYPLVLLLCFLSVFNSSFTVLAADDDENELESTTQIINGQVAIYLDEETQQSSGLKTRQFKKIKIQPELTLYGKAISVSSLLSTLNHYLAISTKQASAKARLASAKKTMARLQNLHKNKAVSSQKFQQYQSQWLSDKAIYDEMVYKRKLIINNSRLQWGEKITQWSTGRHSVNFDNLLTGKSTLLIVTLPAGIASLNTVQTIYISPNGERENAFNASFISLLPTVDKFSQGLQYSFITDSSNIKPGMNFTTWIPLQNAPHTGIIIPETALAWHLGQPFIFIKIDDEYFVHRNISNPVKVSKGYFISEPLTDNEEVVVIGTQMLLSHEFRSQIPDEDDD